MKHFPGQDLLLVHESDLSSVKTFHEDLGRYVKVYQTLAHWDKVYALAIYDSKKECMAREAGR